MAKLVAPGDTLCKPLLLQLYEPALTNIGNGLLVLRGFEREGQAAAQEWRCEVIREPRGCYRPRSGRRCPIASRAGSQSLTDLSPQGVPASTGLGRA